MYLELKQDLIDKIEEITFTDYERKGDYIPAENIENMIKDLLCEIDRLNEKIEDMENDIRDNYRPISNEEMYG